MKKLLISLFCIFTFCLPAFSKKETPVHKPSVITFYQKDCEECDALEEVKQEIMKEYNKNIDFVKIDFDYEDCDFQRLKAKYNIRKAPVTLFINIDEGITKKKEGFISYKEYQSKIKAILGE